MLTLPPTPTSSTPFYNSKWVWIAGLSVLFVAFLVTFLQWRKGKRALKEMAEANEKALKVLAGIAELAKQPTEVAARPEPVPAAEAQPSAPAYEIPILSPLLHFKVRPMPSPYEGAVQMEAWDNLRQGFVRLTRDPLARLGENVRAATGNSGDAWVLQLCHHTGRVKKETLLPIENELEPTSARISNEIKTLLTFTTEEEPE